MQKGTLVRIDNIKLPNTTKHHGELWVYVGDIGGAMYFKSLATGHVRDFLDMEVADAEGHIG